MSSAVNFAEAIARPQLEPRLPDVVLIGAAKAGTTTLAKRLDEHPSIFLSRDKEPEFFSHDENFARGLDWYGATFEGASPDQLCLDASTAYSRSPQFSQAAERLSQLCPQAKIIYLMRHPVDRAYSHYVHRFTKELYPGQPIFHTFEEHVKADPVCLDSSDYRLQLEPYLARFPRESFLFLFTHDLADHESAVVKKVFTFLGLDPEATAFPTRGQRENASTCFRESRVRVHVTDQIKSLPLVGRLVYLLPKPLRVMGYHSLRKLGVGRQYEATMTAPPMRLETRRALLERYRASNAWIAELTGADLTGWNY